jgi:hypothetical protein
MTFSIQFIKMLSEPRCWCSTVGNNAESFTVSRVELQESSHEAVYTQALSP